MPAANQQYSSPSLVSRIVYKYSLQHLLESKHSNNTYYSGAQSLGYLDFEVFFLSQPWQRSNAADIPLDRAAVGSDLSPRSSRRRRAVADVIAVVLLLLLLLLRVASPFCMSLWLELAGMVFRLSRLCCLTDVT